MMVSGGLFEAGRIDQCHPEPAAPPAEPAGTANEARPMSGAASPTPPADAVLAPTRELAGAVGAWLDGLSVALGELERRQGAPPQVMIEELKSWIVEHAVGYQPVVECEQALARLAVNTPCAKALHDRIRMLTQPYWESLDALAANLRLVAELRLQMNLLVRALDGIHDLLGAVANAQMSLNPPQVGARRAAEPPADELVGAVTDGRFEGPPRR